MDQTVDADQVISALQQQIGEQALRIAVLTAQLANQTPQE